MKYLILFLVSFNLWASYLPESKIGQSTDGMTIHSKQANCVAQYSEPCIKFSSNRSYSEIVQDQNLESNNVSCIFCDDEYVALTCADGWNKTKGTSSVYCSKFIPKHVEYNLAQKAIYDSTEQDKEATKETKRVLMRGHRDSENLLTPQEVSDAIKFLLKKGL